MSKNPGRDQTTSGQVQAVDIDVATGVDAVADCPPGEGHGAVATAGDDGWCRGGERVVGLADTRGDNQVELVGQVLAAGHVAVEEVAVIVADGGVVEHQAVAIDGR